MPLAAAKRKTFKPKPFTCPFSGCNKSFINPNGRASHITSQHIQSTSSVPASDERSQNDIPNTEEPSLRTILDGTPATFETPSAYEFGLGIHLPASKVPVVDIRDGPREFYSRASARCETHPLLSGLPCNPEGNFLPDGAPPPTPTHPSPDDYSPYLSRAEFEMADFLYREEQMSAGKIDKLLLIMAVLYDHRDPPFGDHDDLYRVIDSTNVGDVIWQSFSVSYTGAVPEGVDAPPWMTAEYEVWWRNPDTVLSSQLSNPTFKEEIDWAPKRVFDLNGARVYKDFMSANWVWRKADEIAKDEDTHGSAVCPVFLGSDKTTVSVATGNHEYYPLYISNGMIHNSVRRAHRNAVSLLAFLAIPKSECLALEMNYSEMQIADKQYAHDAKFRVFRRQLFHTSLNEILQPLRKGMSTPVVKLCADGHYRRIVYQLGPYIADYPEQALLACIVQGWCPRCTAAASNLDSDPHAGPRSKEHRYLLQQAFDESILWDDYGVVATVIPFTDGFPRADIYELLSPDLLHQLIKGTFKDHLVEWVVDYIKLSNSTAQANKILADIDRRLAVTPWFSGLRAFPEGRDFKQWTGDDSKALMKIFLPAIVGHVPKPMVQALAAFLEFCYLVRRSVIDETCLKAIDVALDRFHHFREIFRETGVRPPNGAFNLPRQHSMKHWRSLIQDFGAPNGVDSSITESKHIKAVKEPYRRSSRYKALGQMLLINQRLDKLAASRIDFTSRGMLDAPLVSPPVDVPSNEDAQQEEYGATDVPTFLGEVHLAKKPMRYYPRDLLVLSEFILQPTFPLLLTQFLYKQLHPSSEIDLSELSTTELPMISSPITSYPSASATFYAPSDLSGIGGMLKERIRSVPAWYGKSPRYDCIYVEQDPNLPGFRGLFAARVLLFFSFRYGKFTYPCALVHWFSPVGSEPCDTTGMWIVEPDIDEHGERIPDIIHIDTILRAAHLIPVYGNDFIPYKEEVNSTNSLDLFQTYYINKFVDYHSHEVAF